MISKTKFLLDEKMIKSLCQSAGIENIKEIRPLGDGEYNAVYEISADRKYALKIAPDANTQVLTYEKGMMKAELYWYDILRKNTSIRVPEIYYSDLSRKLINADWFVMEKLEGVPKNRFAFTPQEKEEEAERLQKWPPKSIISAAINSDMCRIKCMITGILPCAPQRKILPRTAAKKAEQAAAEKNS